MSTLKNTISVSAPVNVVVDSSDNLWVLAGLYGGGEEIHEYNSAGTQLQHFGAPGNGGAHPCGALEGTIGIDGSGNLYLACSLIPYGPFKLWERTGSTWTYQFNPADGAIAVKSIGDIYDSYMT